MIRSSEKELLKEAQWRTCTDALRICQKFCRREGGDSHMKMMEYSPPRLELIMDYAWNQYNRRGITVDCR